MDSSIDFLLNFWAKILTRKWILKNFQEAIVKAVQLAGKEMCITLFNETKRIEEEGGMLICNKTRRRTPGGVFLTLFRQNRSISDEAKVRKKFLS